MNGELGYVVYLYWNVIADMESNHRRRGFQSLRLLGLLEEIKKHPLVLCPDLRPEVILYLQGAFRGV